MASIKSPILRCLLRIFHARLRERRERNGMSGLAVIFLLLRHVLIFEEKIVVFEKHLIIEKVFNRGGTIVDVESSGITICLADEDVAVHG